VEPASLRHWEAFFPKLAELLPREEGGSLCEAFAAELERLREA
jgi:hypothetical protein